MLKLCRNAMLKLPNSANLDLTNHSSSSSRPANMFNECNMPDLATIERVTPAFATSRIGGLSKKYSKEELNHALAQVVRLSDKALYEYQTARSLIIEDIIPGSVTLNFLSVINHLENCINSLARIYKLFSFFGEDEFEKTVSKELKIETINWKDKIIKFRDTIEHMDNMLPKVAKESIPTSSIFYDGTSTIQILSNDRGNLIRYEISTNDLAAIIKNINKMTRSFVEHGIKK